MQYIQSEENKTYAHLKKSCKSKENFFFEGERLVEDLIKRSQVDLGQVVFLFKRTYMDKFVQFFEKLGLVFKVPPALDKEKGKVFYTLLENKAGASDIASSLGKLLEKTICLEDKLFDKLSETVKSQGLAALHLGNFDLALQRPQGNKSVLLEQLQDPGNLGSILRSASAFGYQNVIFVGDCVKLQNPKVIRSSMGALTKLNYFYFANIEEASIFLRQHQMTLCAGSLKGQDMSPFIEQLKEPIEHLVLLIGNEAKGMSKEAEQYCQHLVKIEMEENVESLNASTAFAIMAYSLKKIVKI